MLVVELADILAVHIIQHGDITPETIPAPAFLAINENGIVSVVVLAEMFRALTAAIDRSIVAIPADKVGVISGKSWFWQILPTNAACHNVSVRLNSIIPFPGWLPDSLCTFESRSSIYFYAPENSPPDSPV